MTFDELESLSTIMMSKLPLEDALRAAFRAGSSYAIGSFREFKQTHEDEDSVVNV